MDKEMIYYILLAKYMNINNLKDEMLIFPLNLYFDIDTKISILVEAINQNIKVNETELYVDYMDKKI